MPTLAEAAREAGDEPLSPSELYDLDVRHQINVQRHAAAVVRELMQALAKVEDQIKAAVLAHAWDEVERATAKAARLERMLAEVKETNTDGLVAMLGVLSLRMVELGLYETEFHAAAFADAGLNVKAADLPERADLKTTILTAPMVGRPYKEWADLAREGAFGRVAAELRTAFTEGRTAAEAAASLIGRRALQYRDGVMEQTRRGVEGLARTAITHATHVARSTLNAALGITHERWVSVLDNRTTAVCRARSGTVFPVDSGPRPPAHIRCRSQRVAIVGGFEPPPETYQQWLGRQPTSVQDDILGVAKGKLFRDGGLDLPNFVDATGREYTLEELRRREAGAFSRAGLP